MMFLKEYAWLIIIANVIAWPLAYMTTRTFFAELRLPGSAEYFPLPAGVGISSCNGVYIDQFTLRQNRCFQSDKSLRTE